MNRTAIVGLGLVALGLSACADDHRSTGGGSVEPGEKFAGLYVASGASSIARVDLQGNKVVEVQVGANPARIARAGNRVYVTLRAERRVAVMEDSGNELTTVGSIATGAEPYGVVATADRVYVAASVSGFVGEYDATSFEMLRSWSISGEPRWITMHPSKKGLYVGSAYGGTLTHINLDSGVARAIALPEVQGFNFTDGTQTLLTKRITSDIVSAPDGRNIYVGMLYVDNKSTIPDVGSGDDPCAGGDAVPPPNGGPSMTPPTRDGGGLGCGGGGGYNSQKFNPVIDKVPVDQITSEPVGTEVPEAIQLVGGLQIEDSQGNPINFEAISGYPAALAVSADNAIVFAAIEGAEAILAMKVSQQPGFGGGPELAMGGSARSPNGDAFPPAPGGGSFSFRQIVSVKTGAAPRGIAIVGARAYVHAFFDQKIEEIDVDDVRDVFDFQNGISQPKQAGDTNVGVGSSGVPRQLVSKTPIAVSSDRIDPAFDEGRRLFYATNNPLMATVGAGVSCATCHFDLRSDGLTWTFQRGLRQTPNLSVNLAQTLPVGWAGNVATVADEGFNTSQRLMGGQNLTPEHTGAIQAFLYAAPEIDTPNKALAGDAKVIRGAAVFANVGCISCHAGPAHTDNKVYVMLGLDAVKTRPLSGIAASAPYFHDGSALTLREVVERASRGQMGAQFTVSDADKDALVEYLKSL